MRLSKTGGLFQAAKILPLKNTASFPFGKHRLLNAFFHFIAKMRKFANPRLLRKACGCRILREVYFKRQRYCRLKTLRVSFSINSIIERIFSFHCKNAEIRQSSPFEKGLRLANFEEGITSAATIRLPR